MYQKQFWMFCVLLMIITLLSSVGGGIRFRENFLEEVFDLNDISSEIQNTDNYYPINFNTSVTEENTNEEVIKKVPIIKIEEENIVPIQLEKPKPFFNTPSPFALIEAYSGEAFASF